MIFKKGCNTPRILGFVFTNIAVLHAFLFCFLSWVIPSSLMTSFIFPPHYSFQLAYQLHSQPLFCECKQWLDSLQSITCRINSMGAVKNFLQSFTSIADLPLPLPSFLSLLSASLILYCCRPHCHPYCLTINIIKRQWSKIIHHCLKTWQWSCKNKLVFLLQLLLMKLIYQSF